ncbi:hypothetical protein C8A03DRAFT_38333 [Achaetomium macrosporum]|uniref:DUF7730 domain-containing protein n=1 Tax=Achaetomium macrosporum TaxID=79813 RepID=A0AAN7C3Q8_9PEZI|nr:hypothetical protein C8A03DRAFT_38333 [Achaetomium macrosporum]
MSDSDSDARPTLLRIPGEIRNNIYAHLLLFPHPVHIYRWQPNNNNNSSSSSSRRDTTTTTRNKHKHKHNPSPSSSSSSSSKKNHHRSLSTTLLPLLLTCRQTHGEATALFYAHNRFGLPPSVLRHAPRQTQLNLLFRHFLDRVGPRNAALLRHLVIPFPVSLPLPFAAVGAETRDRDRGYNNNTSNNTSSDGWGNDHDYGHGYGYHGGSSAVLLLLPLLLSALRQRCPNLESLEFDLRWDRAAVMQLMVAAHRPAWLLGGGLGDDEGDGARPVRVAVCLGYDYSGHYSEKSGGEQQEEGAAARRRRGRRLSPSEVRWKRMNRVVEEGLGWRVVVRSCEDDEEEEKEEEEALLEGVLKQPEGSSSSSDWYPREARDPRAAVVWALSERVLQSEVHSRWPGMDWAKSKLQSVPEWLYEEYQRWRHTMALKSIYVRVRWCNREALHLDAVVPRLAKPKGGIRGLFGFRRRRRSDE